MAAELFFDLAFQHLIRQLKRRLLRGLQREKDHRVLPHMVRVLFSRSHDFCPGKIMAVILQFAVPVYLRLKKCSQHGQGERLPEASGSCKKSHLSSLI